MTYFQWFILWSALRGTWVELSHKILYLFYKSYCERQREWYFKCWNHSEHERITSVMTRIDHFKSLYLDDFWWLCKFSCIRCFLYLLYRDVSLITLQTMFPIFYCRRYLSYLLQTIFAIFCSRRYLLQAIFLIFPYRRCFLYSLQSTSVIFRCRRCFPYSDSCLRHWIAMNEPRWVVNTEFPVRCLSETS